jgi:hypothetical protein
MRRKSSKLADKIIQDKKRQEYYKALAKRRKNKVEQNTIK